MTGIVARYDFTCLSLKSVTDNTGSPQWAISVVWQSSISSVQTKSQLEGNIVVDFTDVCKHSHDNLVINKIQLDFFDLCSCHLFFSFQTPIIN